jgi:endonuclease YncB( thermonuclease family)
MDNNARNMLARALLGNGMAGKTADISQLYPQYQQAQIEAQINGQPLPPFEQWAQQFMGQPQQPQSGMPPQDPNMISNNAQ